MRDYRIFKPVFTRLQPCERGDVKIDHVVASKHDSFMEAIRGRTLRHGQTITRLIIRDELAMSDGDHEYRSNMDVYTQARGNVLIAGLGLGYILPAILDKPNVLSVTVIEVNPNVIALVAPTVEHRKLTVIEGDIHSWRPPKGTQYDVIYFDIWGDVSTDALTEMGKLHQSFKFYKAKDGWMDSWDRPYLLSRRRQESSMGW